jgi:hypothetical protein
LATYSTLHDDCPIYSYVNNDRTLFADNAQKPHVKSRFSLDKKFECDMNFRQIKQFMIMNFMNWTSGEQLGLSHQKNSAIRNKGEYYGNNKEWAIDSRESAADQNLR